MLNASFELLYLVNVAHKIKFCCIKIIYILKTLKIFKNV